MYTNELMWIMAWPVMIVLSYYLAIFTLNKLDNQIKTDPTGKDVNP